MVSRITVLFVLLFLFAASGLEAQRSSGQSRSRPRLATPYFSGRTGGYNYGYGAGSAYRLSPYMGYRAPVARTPALPPVSGPVERYSDVEYGEIVQMVMEAARLNNPSGISTGTRQSIVDQTTVSLTGEAAYEPIATGVSDILDRGILLLPTGEELRLRGVTMPSTSDRKEVARIYAREGVQMLRELTSGKEVYIVLDEPLRDHDGRLLGTVILADGTELNRTMLEAGYGTLKAEDFPTGVDYSDLASSEEAARRSRSGLWSREF